MNGQVWTRGRLLECSGQYWHSCTIHAAVRLDLFTAIGDRCLTCENIAQRLGANARGMAMLLNALTAMELLDKSEDGFSNTPTGRQFLSKGSPEYLGYIITHHSHLVDSWSKLDEAVEKGIPVRSRASHSSEEWRENFLMGMFNMAMGLAPRVAAEVDLSGRGLLLDLGGGPGTYAIHFCLKNPRLKATVYDLATTRPFAEKTIDKFGLSDRVTFLPGDYLKDDIGGSYDAAWLSHILHGEGPEDCESVIRKAASALNPGGMLLVHEFILNDSMDGPVFPALFSLNMLLGTAEGQSYSEKQIRNMLARAGANNIDRLPFRGPNDSGIIRGFF
jgi:hypothetical protein